MESALNENPTSVTNNIPVPDQLQPQKLAVVDVESYYNFPILISSLLLQTQKDLTFSLTGQRLKRMKGHNGMVNSVNAARNDRPFIVSGR